VCYDEAGSFTKEEMLKLCEKIYNHPVAPPQMLMHPDTWEKMVDLFHGENLLDKELLSQPGTQLEFNFIRQLRI